jgi:hypothetical protein
MILNDSKIKKWTKMLLFVKSDEVKDTASHFSIKNGVIPIDFDHPEQASVFDYFKAIELIPLETGEDVLSLLLLYVASGQLWQHRRTGIL